MRGRWRREMEWVIERPVKAPRVGCWRDRDIELETETER